MDKKIDAVVGELEYNLGWRKKEKITFLDCDYEVNIVLEAFEGEEITDIQRENYSRFVKDMKIISEKAYATVSQYIDTYRKEVEFYVVKDIVTPRTVLFQQTGAYGILCDFSLDEEHGIAIVISNDCDVVSQDGFL